MPRTLDERKAEWAARWDEIKPAPFRYTQEIVPGLHQVRTRGSRAYLAIQDGVTLIDAGSPGSGRIILQALKELGRSPDEVRDIVITHSHFDHVGGLPEVQRHLPARTAVHFADAAFLASDEPLPNPFTHPVLAKVMEGFLLKNDLGRARVDLELGDGDELDVFGGMRVVHAPGHTPGSISLHFPERGLLLVGDAMQYRFGRLMLPNRLFTADLLQAAESIRKLARLEFETLCFSHFRPIMDGADSRVRALASQLTEGCMSEDEATG